MSMLHDSTWVDSRDGADRQIENHGIWLGSIFWWSGADSSSEPTRVRAHELADWVAELHLDAPSMPKPVSAHTFRAASGSLPARRYTDGNGQRAELEIREVSASAHFIVRHVIKTVTDPRTQTLQHEKVAQLKFYRPTRTAAGRRPGSEVAQPSLKPDMDAIDMEQVLGLIEDFRTAYATRSEFLSMTALRRVVRDFLILRLDAVMIRPSGGIYFIEQAKTAQLDKLAILIARFGTTSCQVIPVIDTPAQRSMVARGVAEELIDDCRSIVTPMCGETTTYQQRFRATEQLARVHRMWKHYAELLAVDEAGLARVQAAVAEADLVVRTLLPKRGELGGKRRLPGYKAPAGATSVLDAPRVAI